MTILDEILEHKRQEVAASKQRVSSNSMADRDEAFNTRLGSYRGWRMAIEKVKPISRTTAQLDLTAMVRGAGCENAQQAVDYLSGRFLSISLDTRTRKRLAAFLGSELGTVDLSEAGTYLEEPLRATLHLILSLPDYQLG